MHVARRNLFLALMLILQAVVAGILLMLSAQVPLGLMASQTAAALLMLPLSFLVAFFAERATMFGERIFLLFVAVTLLFVATRGCHIEGMHRWLCVGPLRIHVPSTLLPSFLVSLSFRRDDDSLTAKGFVFGCATVTSLAVAWSSDLSYTAGLMFGLVVGSAFRRQKRELLFWICLGIGALIIAVSRDVNIPPVLHTEGILTVARSNSALVGVFALLSLLLANVAPFVLWKMFPSTQTRSALLALFFLFSVITIFGFTGVWPVPFLGFGAGPILGAALALGFILGKAWALFVSDNRA